MQSAFIHTILLYVHSMLIISIPLQHFVDSETEILKVIFAQMEVRREGYKLEDYKTELYNYMNEQLRTLQVLYSDCSTILGDGGESRMFFAATFCLTSVS